MLDNVTDLEDGALAGVSAMVSIIDTILATIYYYVFDATWEKYVTPKLEADGTEKRKEKKFQRDLNESLRSVLL